MRQSTWVRALDYLVESCWLLALVAVPIYFDTMTSRIFEPDKIVLFRNIVILMVIAALLRAVLAAPRWMGRRSPPDSPIDGSPRQTTPAWRRFIGCRPLLIPVVLFVVVYTAATVDSVLPGISFWGSYDRLQGLYTWLSYIAFFLVLIASLRTWAQVERIISALAFGSLPVALYGIVQHLQWDPVAWGAPTNVRVASTLGNAIFLGAYLIMCMPFAAYRLWRAVERWRADHQDATPAQRVGQRDGAAERGSRGGSARRATTTNRKRARSNDVIEITGLPSIVPVIGYAVILVVDFAALYYCGSRGPYYGFLAAIFVFGALLTVKWENPNPFIVAVGLDVVLFGFLYVAGALLPAIALVLLVAAVVAAGVALSRRVVSLSHPILPAVALLIAIFAFPQAINVFSPVAASNAADSQHLTDTGINGTSEVRAFIWQGSLHLIAHRPILGYGPETMIYVYSPYYPSGLGHIEHANAAPDRNHDEWLDFVVFSGVIGLIVWLVLLATFAYVGVMALRRARSRRAVIVIAAIGAVVVGHLAEASVGIDIVSTLMLLWTMFAFVTVFYARPDLLGAAAVPASVTGVPVAVAAGAAETAVRTPVGAASGSRGNGARGRSSQRAGQRAGQRGGNGRSPRNQANTPAPPVRTGGFDRLNGVQQLGLAGLILLTLIATVGGAALFGYNVQVVRADSFYKQGQSYDSVGAACLAAARNQPGGDPCVFTAQYKGRQLADVAGVDLLPTALNYYQEATAAQPNQDMYYLWTGKTYLDEAQYYLAIGKRPDAFTQFTNAETALMTARSLNPYNADHPMNLGRMYHGWSGFDASKWPLADKYFRIATGLALHNGRWWDEWGNADMDQAAHRAGLTPAQRTTVYRHALAEFQHACQVDDLLGDARVFRGNAYAALGMNKEAAASYAEALQVGRFETFVPPATGLASPGAVENLVAALSAAHEYKALVQPTRALLPAGTQSGGPAYLGQSPITLAYSPALGISTSPFSATLQAISSTLRLKGLVK